MAKVQRKVPLIAGKEFDAASEALGQDREAMIALEGPAQIDRDDIEVIQRVEMADKAATEAFMAEMVTILIYPSAEKFPENPVQLGVNGRNVFIWRNAPTMVKRCYLERLVRARNEAISQDAANPVPEVANKLHISAALRYPFSVVKDPNPKGQAWLQALMAEA